MAKNSHIYGMLGALLMASCALNSSKAPYPASAPRVAYEVAPGEEPPALNTEAYDRIYENPFLAVTDNPLSTFSIDVDTASYSNVRRFLGLDQRPPRGAVRIEELINYFSYDYPEPEGDAPFSVAGEVSTCPWSEESRLVHIGLKGRSIQQERMPPRNLVFLLDVSGSMGCPNKLPLLKSAMRLLVEQLGEQDHVSMVVYAGASGLVLPPTSGDQGRQILEALDRLEAGGSTNGGAGIELAYKVARQHFRPDGINRVILATDGDFNVGTTSQGGLIRLIEKERESGVFLTVLGFGMGNLKDSTMEKLADKGNGNYAYIDTLNEARKVLVIEGGSTLVTIAKDVKLQIEFNPTFVKAYRLIGYENRMLRAEDFNDDRKDAGEIGAGHTVTALYEIVPVGSRRELPGVDQLRYQARREPTADARSDELLTIKLRYKQPDSDTSQLIAGTILDRHEDIRRSSDNHRLAAAVAAFGMLLRDSEHKGQASFEMVRSLAESARGSDPHGYRAEFIELVHKAEKL